jgi:hypothetical protein
VVLPVFIITHDILGDRQIPGKTQANPRETHHKKEAQRCQPAFIPGHGFSKVELTSVILLDLVMELDLT